MKRITEFNFRKLRVSELGAFSLNLVATIGELQAAGCIPKGLAERFEHVQQQHRQSIGRKTDKQGTTRSREINLERNDLILSIKGAIQMAKHRTPELREAARHVEYALRKRGWNMHRKTFEAKTNSIKLLLADVSRSADLQAAMATVRCDDLLEQLDQANNQFVESEEQRRAQKLAQKGIGNEAAKAELCKEISRIFGYLDAVSGIDPEVERAIGYINLLIDPLAARIKARATNAKKKQQGSATNEAAAQEEPATDLVPLLEARGVELQQDEEQHGEGPERRPSVADEGQRDAHHGRQPDGHANVNGEVEEEDREHPVAEYAGEGLALPIGNQHDPEEEQRE